MNSSTAGAGPSAVPSPSGSSSTGTSPSAPIGTRDVTSTVRPGAVAARASASSATAGAAASAPIEHEGGGRPDASTGGRGREVGRCRRSREAEGGGHREADLVAAGETVEPGGHDVVATSCWRRARCAGDRRLPHAPETVERDDPVRLQQLEDLGHRRAAADEAGQRGRVVLLLADGEQGRVVGQQAQLDSSQVLAEIGAQLLAQQLPGSRDRPQRLGLAAQAEQGDGQLGPAPLAERLALDRELQAAMTVAWRCRASSRSAASSSTSRCRSFQFATGMIAQGSDGEPAEGLAPPEGERGVEVRRGAIGLGGGQAAGVGDEQPEALDVDLLARAP